MAGWGVIPTIRIRDLERALAFYRGPLGFELTRGTAEEDNCSLSRGDARLMLERAGSFYSEAYNQAIGERGLRLARHPLHRSARPR